MNLHAQLLSLKVQTLNQTLAELKVKITIDELPHALIITLGFNFPYKVFQAALSSSIHQLLIEKQCSLPIKINYQMFIQSHRTQLPGQHLRGVKNIIAVASGKGGVGKSTVALLTAVELAKMGAKVGVLDADIHGPSIPLMLGTARLAPIENDFYLPLKNFGIEAISIANLIDSKQAVIWRGPMLAKALMQLLNLTLWQDIDYLIIDLPPGTGDIQLSLVQKIPLVGAVIVTTPQSVATVDAEKAIQMFDKLDIPVLGVIENMAFFNCPNCQHPSHLFGKHGGAQLCQTYQKPLLEQLPLVNHLSAEDDNGLLVLQSPNHPLESYFQSIGLQLSAAVSLKPLNYSEKFPPVHKA